MGLRATRRRGVGRSRTTMPRGSGSIRCIGAGCRSRTQRGIEDDARRGARSGARQAPGPARGDDCRRGRATTGAFLDTLAAQGTAVVDFYHAAEHLKSGLDACYGEGNAKGRAHYEKLRHLLRHDCAGVEKVIRSLNHLRRDPSGEQAYRRSVGILAQQPSPHGLCRGEGPASAHWLGGGGGGVQDAGDPADEAFGDCAGVTPGGRPS